MPNNSFRLFVVSLHDGQARQAQYFESAQARTIVRKDEDGKKHTETPPPVDYRELIVEEVDANQKAFVYGRKKIEDDADEVSEFGGHVIRWIKASRVSAASRFWFEAGPVSSEGVLVDPEGIDPDLDLGKDIRATLHRYRAALITKPGLQYGILAVEARGARCPKDQLVRALRDSSPQGWSLRVQEGVAQKAAVLDFIDRADIVAVTFTEYGYGRDGAKRAPQLKRLRIDEVLRGVDRLRRAARDWVQRAGRSGGAAAAAELLTLVVTEEVDIAFNDVAVEFDDKDQQRTIRPTTDYRRFSYFLGRDIVNDEKFFEASEKAASEIIDEVQAIVDDEE